MNKKPGLTGVAGEAAHELSQQQVQIMDSAGAVQGEELHGQETWRHASSLMCPVNTLSKSLDAMLEVSRLDISSLEVE